MCEPLLQTDDITESPAIVAFDALQAAEKHLLSLTLRISEGAVRYGFPKHDPDTAISRAVGEVTKCRFEFDRALASEVMGEKCALPPSPSNLSLALQRRVMKNEEASGVLSLGPTIAAARRVDAADHVRRPLADLDADFHSGAGG